MTVGVLEIHGLKRVEWLKPADSNEADLFEATEDHTIVAALWACNNTASPVAATIQFYELASTTDWEFIDTEDVAANTTSFWNEVPLPMRSGDKIKVTSETGSALTFGCLVLDPGGLAREIVGHHAGAVESVLEKIQRAEVANKGRQGFLHPKWRG